jgi:hypothetical protein
MCFALLDNPPELTERMKKWHKPIKELLILNNI